MGWSCNAAAGETLNAIQDEISAKVDGSSNSLPDGGFFEVGREQRDGAITGTIWRPVNGNATHKLMIADPYNGVTEHRVRRAGTFRIEPNGKIKRFPGLTREQIRMVESVGARRYARKFGPPIADYRERARELATALSTGATAPVDAWEDFEDIARAYQREKRIMFFAMPDCNAPDMMTALAFMAKE